VALALALGFDVPEIVSLIVRATVHDTRPPTRELTRAAIRGPIEFIASKEGCILICAKAKSFAFEKRVDGAIRVADENVSPLLADAFLDIDETKFGQHIQPTSPSLLSALSYKGCRKRHLLGTIYNDNALIRFIAPKRKVGRRNGAPCRQVVHDAQ
jgi:hypothetical protein